MFFPVAYPDDEEEHLDGRDDRHGEEEVLRFEFAAAMPMIIKVKNFVLVLGLGVAVFIQYCTLESQYLNTLMWGEQEDLNLNYHQQARGLIPPTVKTIRSVLTILFLVFLRAIIFPYSTQHATSLEVILADLLFQMRCRFVIGLLVCFAPVPFERIEAAVVVLSVAFQTTTSTVVAQ